MKSKDKSVKTVSRSKILFAWLILIILILLIFSLIYIKFFQIDTNDNNINGQNSSEVNSQKALEDLIDNFNNSQLLKQYKKDGIDMVAILESDKFSVEVIKGSNTNVYVFEYNYPELSCTILPDSMEEFDSLFEILLYENQKRLGNGDNIDNYVDGILNGNLNVIGFNKVVADELVAYSMDISRIMGDEEIK